MQLLYYLHEQNLHTNFEKGFVMLKVRLYCKHCDKFYEVDKEDVKLVQTHHNDAIHYERNTYFYEDNCFFQEIKKIKSTKE